MATLPIKDANGVTRYLVVTGSGTELDPYTPTQSIRQIGEVQAFFGRYMDTVGDGTGSRNQAVNGATTPVSFYIKPGAGEIIRIARLITSLRDSGSFDSGGWGNSGGLPLTNGIELFVKQGGVENNLTEEPIRSHYDLASTSYDVSYNSWGSGDEFLTNRFTFTKSGQPIRLIGDNGDWLRVQINDDLSYLVDQRVDAQGYYEGLTY